MTCTTMNSYGQGNLVRLSVAFTAVGDSSAVDPTAVQLEVRAPDQTITTYTYADGDLTRDGQGLYHFDLATTQYGYYNYRFRGSGNLVASVNGQFKSLPDPLST